MSAKVVGITRPENIGIGLSPEEFIVYLGRISNPENQENLDTSERLLRHLLREKHWSPFDMVDVIMEINTTRDVTRQMIRHRSFFFQEFSFRYANALKLGFELSEARLQDTKNRQNSLEVDNLQLQQAWTETQERVVALVTDSYEQALQQGIAKEVARKLLPEGLIRSRVYMKGTVRNWIHYCQLRMGNGTQKEHKLVAKAAFEALRPYFPIITQIMED
jgi:thymidylate synthase (FAD)